MILKQPEMQINIGADSTQLTITHKDGTKESKPVDIGELSIALASNVEHNFGLLPRGVRDISQKGPNIVAVIEVPGRQHDLQYGRKVLRGCNLPTAIFMLRLFKKTDGRLSIGDTNLFALRQQHVSLATDSLFHYPAPNVYPDSHRVCWGNALEGISTIKSLSALTSICLRYFSAPFNSDLFRAGDLSNAFPWSETDKDVALVEGYFSFIRDQPFDNTWLRPALPAYSNYGKALTAIKGGDF